MARAGKYRMRDIKGKKVLDVRIIKEVDQDPDLSYLTDESRYGTHATKKQIEKYREQDRERLESYGTDWWMVGIWAEAEVIIDNVTQKVRSGGLWGIESDSDQGYFEDVAEEEYNQLKAILKKMGFKKMPRFGEAEWMDAP